MKINWKSVFNPIALLAIAVIVALAVFLEFPYSLFSIIGCTITAYAAYTLKKEKVIKEEVEVIKEVPVEVIKEVYIEQAPTTINTKVENIEASDIEVKESTFVEAPKLSKARKRKAKKAGSDNNNLLSEVSKEKVK